MIRFVGVVVFWKGYDESNLQQYEEGTRLSYKKLPPASSCEGALADAKKLFDEMRAKKCAYDKEKDWDKGPIYPDEPVLYAASPVD